MLKNEDINLLIKMENLIGINEKKIFGRNKNKGRRDSHEHG